MKKRGFGSMDPEKQRAIASQGGKSVKAENRYFSTNREAAKICGRKGGTMSNGGGRKKKDEICGSKL